MECASKKEEEQFFERLSLIAGGEALLIRCGQPDNFAARAREAIRACVTKEALDRAEKFFDTALNGWSKYLEASKQSCQSVKLTYRPSLAVGISTAIGGSSGNSVHGALVAWVNPFGPAQAAGMKAGDLITKINDKAISNHKELADALSELSASSIAKICVERDGKEVILSSRLIIFSYGPDGQVTQDGPKLVAYAHKRLEEVISEIGKLCLYCKSSIYALFCR